MFYSWEVAVAAANTVNNKKQIDLPMSAGIIHQVDVLFPDTADHNIRVQVWDRNLQMWPSNRNATIRGDATVVSFRDFYEMRADNNVLQARAWWEDASTECSVFVQIGVLPRSVLQPFSLAELLRAVQRR